MCLGTCLIILIQFFEHWQILFVLERVLQVFLIIVLHFYLQLDLPFLPLPKYFHIVSWPLSLHFCPRVSRKLSKIGVSEGVELEDGYIFIGNVRGAVVGTTERVVIECYLLWRTEVRTDINTKVH